MRSPSRTILALIATAGMTAGLSGPVAARPVQDAPGTVVRAGDDALTCRQMADEAAALSADMGDSGPGLLGRVGGIARAGATLLVPGAGLAVAGADALTAPGKERREAEADTRRDRWNYLNGLYAGRGCEEGGGENRTAAVAPAADAPATAAAAPATVPVQVRPPSITPAAFPH